MSAYEWWKENVSDELAEELAKSYANYVYGPTSSVWKELFDRLQDLCYGKNLADLIRDVSTPGIKGVLKRVNLISGITSGTRAMSFAFGWPVPTSDDIAEQQVSYSGTDNPPVVFTMQGGIYQLTGNIGSTYPAYTAGILTVPLEKLVCNVAPLFGYSIDNEAFFHTHEWYALREACVQYLWDGTDVAPVLIANANKAYAESNLVNEIGRNFGIVFGDKIYAEVPSDSAVYSSYGPIAVGYNSASGDVLYTLKSSSSPTGYVFYRAWMSGNGVFYFYDSYLLGAKFPWLVFCSENSNARCYLNSSYTTFPERDMASATKYTMNYVQTAYGNYYTFSVSLSAEYVDSPIVPDWNTFDISSPPLSGAANQLGAIILYSPSPVRPDGVSRWTGNQPSPTWNDDCVYVYKNPDDTVKFVKVYVDPLERNITWNPTTQPDPQADTPPENTSPYVPSNETPMPSPVPSPSPTIDVPSPSDPSYDPSDPLDNDDIIKLVDYDDSIVTPEITPPTSPTETYPLPSGYTGTSGTSGMIHVYRPSPTAFNDFAAWLWVKWSDPVSVPRFWNNPIDGIISAHELYWGGHASGSEFIRSGFLESTVSAPVVDARYDTLDCGSVDVPEYYGTYMDYSPYVKVSVYLPFVGIVELNPDDIIGAQVHIIYNTDAYTGACLAQILCTKGGVTQKLYEYNGNCAVTIPLSGGTQAQIVTGLLNAGSQVINGVGQLVTTALTGGAPNIGGLASDVLGAASTVLSAKSSVQHSGTFSSNYGAMGSKKPYLIIRRPIVVNATNFNLEYGYPAHKRVTIGACTGYLRVREVNVVSATATDEEKQEIESLLKAGVYVS